MLSIYKSCRVVGNLKRLSHKITAAPLSTIANPLSSGLSAELSVRSVPAVGGKRFLSTAADKTHNITFTTISDMQRQVCALYPNRNVFGTRKGDVYEWMKYSEFGRDVQLCRNVLTKHNVGAGDKVCLIANNRVEWAVVYFAAVSLGAQVVPM